MVETYKYQDFSDFDQIGERVRLEIQENELFILWDPHEDIPNLTFTQPSSITDSVTYLVTNGAQMFKVPFIDFRFFREE